MKKILALLLALSMLFALTACGGDNKTTPTGESTGETTSTTESTTNITDGTEDSTQGTTEGTTGTETTEPPTTTTPPPTTPPTTDAPHTHSYSSKVTTAATCSKEGVKTFTCSCGDSYTEKITATGHKWGEWKQTTPPSHTAKGEKTRNCKNCSATETEDIAIMGEDEGAMSPIVDAVNYEKDVVVVPNLEELWDPQGIKHRIKIPKIASKAAEAQKLNQKIYNNHCHGYELLVSNQEAELIFDCSYEYKVYKGVVAIAVLDMWAAQCGGWNPFYNVYYYSLDEDRVLTFDDYLEAVGISYDTVVLRIMDTDAYKQEGPYITNMMDCLLDENGTSAFFEIDSMPGWSEIKTTSVLDN